MKAEKFKTVEEYIASQTIDKRAKLKEVRATIKKAAPGAEEVISYNIPSFKLDGSGLIWYAAHKEHIGMYPISAENKDLKKEFAGYAGSKGTIRFPLDKPMPLGLISKLVKYRIKQNNEKAKKSGL